MLLGDVDGKVGGVRVRRGGRPAGRPLSEALDGARVREERVLERVVEAGLAAEGFGQKVWLWDVAVVSDEHANGTAGVYYQYARFIGRQEKVHSSRITGGD